jgi:hypothetical protein
MEGIQIILGITLLVFAILTSEIRNFRLSSIFLSAFGVVLTAILAVEQSLAAIASVIVVTISVPLLIRFTVKKINIFNEEPARGPLERIPMVTIFAVAALIVALLSNINATSIVIGTPVLVAGIVSIITKGNLIKLLIGFVLIHVGAAISAFYFYELTLKTQLFEIASFTLLLFIALSVTWFTVALHSKKGTISLKNLTELKW